jgi:uncharacterized protein YqfA (UPF0365 family)
LSEGTVTSHVPHFEADPFSIREVDRDAKCPRIECPKIEENKALVVLAEAEVPRAMADAFRSGNFGIMDYYKMKNVQADTAMRGSIAGDGHTQAR